MRKSTLVILVALLLPTMAYAQKDAGFYGAVVDQVSLMFKVDSPTRIQVELLTQKELQKWFKEEFVKNCTKGWRGNIDRRIYCSQEADNVKAFLKGRWIPEDDTGYFHVILHENSGLETFIHEYMHYVLHYMTEPAGLVNDHAVLHPMVVDIMTSPEFIEFLEGLEK